MGTSCGSARRGESSVCGSKEDRDLQRLSGPERRSWRPRRDALTSLQRPLGRREQQKARDSPGPALYSAGRARGSGPPPSPRQLLHYRRRKPSARTQQETGSRKRRRQQALAHMS